MLSTLYRTNTLCHVEHLNTHTQKHTTSHDASTVNALYVQQAEETKQHTKKSTIQTRHLIIIFSSHECTHWRANEQVKRCGTGLRMHHRFGLSGRSSETTSCLERCKFTASTVLTPWIDRKGEQDIVQTLARQCNNCGEGEGEGEGEGGGGWGWAVQGLSFLPASSTHTPWELMTVQWLWILGKLMNFLSS